MSSVSKICLMFMRKIWVPIGNPHKKFTSFNSFKYFDEHSLSADLLAVQWDRILYINNMVLEVKYFAEKVRCIQNISAENVLIFIK